jgi:hypothetical protein
MADSRLRRLAAGCVVLPHELAHALPAVVAGLSPEITLLPDHDGAATPLGRFDADLDAMTPPWVVRSVALAPLVVYVGAAVLLRATVDPGGPSAVVAVGACAYWASLSAGDLAVASNPEAALSSGRFAADVSARLRATADLSTVATTLLVGVLLLA